MTGQAVSAVPFTLAQGAQREAAAEPADHPRGNIERIDSVLPGKTQFPFLQDPDCDALKLCNALFVSAGSCTPYTVVCWWLHLADSPPGRPTRQGAGIGRRTVKIWLSPRVVKVLRTLFPQMLMGLPANRQSNSSGRFHISRGRRLRAEAPKKCAIG